MSNLENSATEFAAITSQDELDRIISARVARERAKYADYDVLKSSAADAEKAKADHAAAIDALKAEHSAAIEALKAEKETSEAELLKLTVASDKGVPAKLLTGSTKEELEKAAEALLEFKNAGNDPHAQHNGPAFGLDGADAFANRDAEARLILGL